MPRLFGTLSSINIANPAAGANWAFQTPAGTVAIVLCCSFTFTTSAAATNRCVGVVHQSGGGGNGGNWRSGVLQGASLTNTYTFPATVMGASDPVGAPGVILIPGPGELSLISRRTVIPGVLSSNVHSIDVADQFSNIWLLVETWHE